MRSSRDPIVSVAEAANWMSALAGVVLGLGGRDLCVDIPAGQTADDVYKDLVRQGRRPKRGTMQVLGGKLFVVVGR